MPTERERTVGFIGLGSMGLGMARVLTGKGFSVRGYDINPEAVSMLLDAGGYEAGTPGKAASGAGVLVLMVTNANQVDEVLFGPDGAAAALCDDGVVILCSTVSPGFARSTAERLVASGRQMLDAPVSGGAVGAKQGALSIMASGPDEAFDRGKEVLEALGRTVHRIGNECGQGSTMKMVNQLLAGVHLAAAAEAVALGVCAGIDSRRIFEVIAGSAGNSWMFQDRVPRMLAGEYTPPRGAVDIFVKDLGIVLDAGGQLRFPLPVASAAHQVFLMAAAAGHGRLDDSAVVKVYEQLAGITVGAEPSKTHSS